MLEDDEELIIRRDCDVSNTGEGSLVILGEISAGTDVCTVYRN